MNFRTLIRIIFTTLINTFFKKEKIDAYEYIAGNGKMVIPLLPNEFRVKLKEANTIDVINYNGHEIDSIIDEIRTGKYKKRTSLPFSFSKDVLLIYCFTTVNNEEYFALVYDPFELWDNDRILILEKLNAPLVVTEP